MKKMTLFVEGQTELHFANRLLSEVIDNRKLQIVLLKASGGSQRSVRRFQVLQDSDTDTEKSFYIQIISSETDHRVRSDIQDNYDSLVQEGYDVIIGIRDVYPIPSKDIPKLRAGLAYRLKTEPISVCFVLGVMEIEAWFLANHTHFQYIHSDLTVSRIYSELGFNPSIEDMQTRSQPAKDLHEIYALEGLAYRKTRNQIQRTIDVLDYAEIYLSHRDKFPDINVLMNKIDEFFA